MQGNLIELIQYRKNKAEETLRAAETLYNEGYFNSAVNRSYYACFYMVSALLQMYDITAAKHSGVRHLFNINFIKNGTFEKEIGRFYSELFNQRQESDYEDYKVFAKEETNRIIEKSKFFIKTLKNFIDEKLK